MPMCGYLVVNVAPGRVCNGKVSPGEFLPVKRLREREKSSPRPYWNIPRIFSPPLHYKVFRRRIFNSKESPTEDFVREIRSHQC